MMNPDDFDDETLCGSMNIGKSGQSSSLNNFGRHQFTLSELLAMIDLIRQCELIWNKNHPEYSHGLSRAVAFDQIASTLRIPVDDIRWKWQILRKEYFKKMSQNQKHMAGVSNNKVRPWKWSGPLSFLDSVISQQKNTSSNSTTKQQSHQSDLSSISKRLLKNLFKSSPSSSTNAGSSILASNSQKNVHQTLTNHQNLNNNNNSEDSEHSVTTDNSAELQLNPDNLPQMMDHQIIDLDGDDQDEDDEDQNEPQFFCETIYSPTPEEDENSDVFEPQEPIVDCTVEISNYNRKNICHNRKRDSLNNALNHHTIYYNKDHQIKKRKQHLDGDMLPNSSSFQHKLQRLHQLSNGDPNSSNMNDCSDSDDTSAILAYLKTQNEILLQKSNREDLIWKQLVEKDSEINRIREREQQWLQRQEDPLMAYLMAKLSLLQDLPRTSEWVNQFQLIMDKAFKDIYNSFYEQQKLEQTSVTASTMNSN